MNKLQSISFFVIFLASLASFALSKTTNETVNLAPYTKTIQKSLPSLSPCYTKHGRSRAINMKVSWDIVKNGKVEYPTVTKSSYNNIKFKKCIVGAIKKWTFKKAKQIITMTYPIQFAAN